MSDEQLKENLEKATKHVEDAPNDNSEAIKYAVQLLILIVGEILKRVLK